MEPQPRLSVTVECVGCHGRREIGPNEVPAGNVPTCSRCYLPMVPIKAEANSAAAY